MSKITVFPGEIVTVSGLAKYWNSTYLPKDLDPSMSTLIPCEGCYANLTVDGTPYSVKCGADGSYSVQITAPATPGNYTISPLIQNSTPNRNVSTSVVAKNLQVIPLPVPQVSMQPAFPLSAYPGKPFLINGTAKYGNGTAVANSPVMVTITQTGISTPSTTNSTGGFSVQITGPATPGAYTAQAQVTSALYGTQGTNSTPFTVQQPTLSASIFPSSTTLLPGTPFWVNGTARYGNGEAASGAAIFTVIQGTAANVSAVAAANGSFSCAHAAPMGVATYTVNLSAWGSTYNVWAYNQTPIVVTPVPVPDLSISPTEVGHNFTGKQALEWNNVSLWAVARNLGIANAANALVSFTLGNATIGNVTVSLLPVGGSANVSVNWTAIPGNHTIRVAVDPADTIDESLEGNNNATFAIDVDSDTDGDDIGNGADEDDDNDGYSDAIETALGSDPLDNRSMPSDIDRDLIPDVYDEDMDGDGYNNTADLFPKDPNEWNDTDGDDIGDNSDPDIDGDGVENGEDAFPFDGDEWSDTDGDNTGNNADPDDDNDGTPDEWEMLLGTDPLDGDSRPADTDGDGAPDGDTSNSQQWMDIDDDGDGVKDRDDAFPKDSTEVGDLDKDGIGDNADPDDDNDGVPDAGDQLPRDTDNDGLPNNIDLDDDGDGILDWFDQHPLDTDNDGSQNNVDLDDDGDGIPDASDRDPLSPETGSIPIVGDLMALIVFSVPLSIISAVAVALTILSGRGRP